MSYRAPIEAIEFALDAYSGIKDTQKLPDFAGQLNDELVKAILNEAGRFAQDWLAPLNESGDRTPARVENGVVRASPGFAEAYQKFVAAGWLGMSQPKDRGGQALPFSLTMATWELWASANLAFSLCPLLTGCAADMLVAHGNESQQALLLPHLVSGHWTGAMNLTEPQAGSDLGRLQCSAEPADDLPLHPLGQPHRIRGQKIFITWGDHDMTENILHFVLARLPDAPAGAKGISLFVAPKFIVDENGRVGKANDLRPLSVERKIGIHASPTCVMSYGENEGAIAYRVGAAHEGLRCMFTMMNGARIGVGLEGMAMAERACQLARNYALTRVQGYRNGRDATLASHPDVRRNLLLMRAQTEGARALCYFTAGVVDRLEHASLTEEAKRTAQCRLDILTPIVKAWCSDIGCHTTSIGVQILGGMGYVEEAGAGQLWRDARITPIYEGANGIQARDLVGRKLAVDDGASLRLLLAEMEADEQRLRQAPHIDPDQTIALHLASARATLDTAQTEMLARLAENGGDRALAGATPFLELAGAGLAGWLLAKGALENDGKPGFERRCAIARYFASQILPSSIATGKASVGPGVELALDWDEEEAA